MKMKSGPTTLFMYKWIQGLPGLYMRDHSQQIKRRIEAKKRREAKQDKHIDTPVEPHVSLNSKTGTSKSHSDLGKKRKPKKVLGYQRKNLGVSKQVYY